MKKILLFSLVIIIVLFAGCVEQGEKINLSIIQEPDIREDGHSIKVAIASVVSPKESYEQYEKMVEYIEEKLGVPVKIIQRRNYTEINDLLKTNKIDFAFVCSGAYIDGNSEFGMKLLVAPKMYGRTTYHSYIIVSNKSNYTELANLRGKKFAFSDPLSNSGYLYPAYRLSMINESPDSFFGVDKTGRNNYIFTYSHDNSVTAVAEGLAEGAAVDSLVYDYLSLNKPDVVSKTRIIEVSPPFGIPPVVVPKNSNSFLEKRLREIFINMDKDEEGKKILSGIMIDKFVIIDDNAYDSIRDMREKVK
jgi:phosphonate transport system substrate-binding protein